MAGCAGAADGDDGESVGEAELGASGFTAGVATAYNTSTAVVSVRLPNGSTVKLHHTDGTSNVSISNPEIVPNPVCRTMARQWNLDVAAHRSPATFRAHLATAAANNCGLEYVAGALNGDGSFQLSVVRPAP